MNPINKVRKLYPEAKTAKICQRYKLGTGWETYNKPVLLTEQRLHGLDRGGYTMVSLFITDEENEIITISSDYCMSEFFSK